MLVVLGRVSALRALLSLKLDVSVDSESLGLFKQVRALLLVVPRPPLRTDDVARHRLFVINFILIDLL